MLLVITSEMMPDTCLMQGTFTLNYKKHFAMPIEDGFLFISCTKESLKNMLGMRIELMISGLFDDGIDHMINMRPAL